MGAVPRIRRFDGESGGGCFRRLHMGKGRRGLYYYRSGLDGTVLLARRPLAPEPGPALRAIPEAEAARAERLLYCSERPGPSKVHCSLNHAGYLAEAPEGLWSIDAQQLSRLAEAAGPLPAWLARAVEEGRVGNLNLAEASPAEALPRLAAEAARAGEKKTVHILAMGDVGSTVLTGLALLGGDCIAALGIYDFDRARCERWAMELNQTAYPWAYDRLPPVRVLEEAELFACDVFVFCASAGVPPVGEKTRDVRMAQLEANRAIVGQYARQARACDFRGLFAVVSDPVDQLCQAAWRASNRDDAGQWDGRGLWPEQIQGYGLGVMNSRAAYFAKQDPRFARFLTEGRAYGPHGAQLVIADSVARYDDARSRELTRRAAEANLAMRELGYKPYVAPALSSAAISLLLTLRGHWHYSSNFLGGIWLGARNRSTLAGVEFEYLPLPAALRARIEEAERELRRTGAEAAEEAARTDAADADEAPLLVIAPEDAALGENPRLRRVAERALAGRRAEVWRGERDFAPVRGRRILFVLHLGAAGVNLEYQRLLRWIRTRPGCLRDCVGAVLADGAGELHTKAAGRELVLAANAGGCAFPGRPLVEGTGSLRNFLVQADLSHTGCEEAYCRAAGDLAERLLAFRKPRSRRPKLLAVHASSRETSNTLTLWRKVRAHLETRCEIREIPLENGAVEDCIGCPYPACQHYGETCGCYYGGVMVEEVYPAVLECDALVLLCPNYNDAMSANLAAFVNRLTALSNQVRFFDKALFALVISGYSGGDLVAEQILGALNLNKSFWLPPRFALLATADASLRVEDVEGIDAEAADFAENLLRQISGGEARACST